MESNKYVISISIKNLGEEPLHSLHLASRPFQELFSNRTEFLLATLTPYAPFLTKGFQILGPDKTDLHHGRQDGLTWSHWTFFFGICQGLSVSNTCGILGRFTSSNRGSDRTGDFKDALARVAGDWISPGYNPRYEWHSYWDSLDSKQNFWGFLCVC